MFTLSASLSMQCNAVDKTRLVKNIMQYSKWEHALLIYATMNVSYFYSSQVWPMKLNAIKDATSLFNKLFKK